MLPKFPFIILALIGGFLTPTHGAKAGSTFRPACPSCVNDIVSKSSTKGLSTTPKQSVSSNNNNSNTLFFENESLFIGTSKLNSRWLLNSRQTETCDPGYYMCSDGTGCCAIGESCVPGGQCCPESAPQPCGSSRCYDPSTQVCCASRGTYCPKGWDCVAAGCCPAGHAQCGAGGCYDPETQVCCPNDDDVNGGGGGNCEKGQVCVGGGCCPAGNVQCGEGGCYDSATEVCCAATGRHCEEGYDCVDGGEGCCPSGQKPCGESKCYDPETQVCCTSGSLAWACKQGASCCESAGSCYDSETEICCDGGACLKGETCCKEECCSEIATCGSDGLCTAKTTSTTKFPTTSARSIPSTGTTASTPAISTIKPSTTSSGPSTTSSGCTTPTLTTSQTRTETVTFEYNPSRTLVAKAGPSKGATFTDTNAAVLMNMCDGIRSSTGKTSQGMLLTYGGKCFIAQNRKLMCPSSRGKRWCAAGVASYLASIYPSGTAAPSWAAEALTSASDMWCDEFPFANSLEGGDPAKGARACVPSADQTWQGRVLSDYFRLPSPLVKPGEKYAVLIKGWDCKTQKPAAAGGAGSKRANGEWDGGALMKRDAFSSAINVTGPEMWHNYDSSEPRLHLMPMPLGDLVAGDFRVSLGISGNLSDILVTDSSGNTYDASRDSDGGITFSLPGDTDGLSLSGTTKDENVEVVYQASQLASTETLTSIAPTATTTSISTSSNHAPAPTLGPHPYVVAANLAVVVAMAI